MALVGADGSIDGWPVPNLDGPRSPIACWPGRPARPGNLGLLHGQTDPGTGATPGNRSQALNHLALAHVVPAVDEGFG